jgi:hypothetical protein
MATDHHRNGEGTRKDGAQGRAAVKWLSFALGFAWMLTRVRRRFAPRAFPAASQGQTPAAFPFRGHEDRDANIAWIFGVVAFLFVSGVAIHFILAAWLTSLKKSPPMADRWQLDHQARTSFAPPDSYPHLQLSPPADLEAFRSREDAELNSYGWLNRTAGVVRVPISRAMDLVLQEGLPTRNGQNQDQPGPSSAELLQHRADHHEQEFK